MTKLIKIFSPTHGERLRTPEHVAELLAIQAKIDKHDWAVVEEKGEKEPEPANDKTATNEGTDSGSAKIASVRSANRKGGKA